MLSLAEVEQRAARVRVLLLDCDGVLTDGRITLLADGDEQKSFHTRDGHGLVLLHRAGLQSGALEPEPVGPAWRWRHDDRLFSGDLGPQWSGHFDGYGRKLFRAALDWSHALLDQQEQAVFRRLAVFAGGFRIAAAEAVCGSGVGPSDILDHVANLVDKSLVVPPAEGERYHARGHGCRRAGRQRSGIRFCRFSQPIG